MEEAYAAFEYENVHVGIPIDRANEVRMLRDPPLGVAFQKRRERLREELTRLCEEIANELVRWPREEGALDAALRGGSACVGAATPRRVGPRLCPSRAWSRSRPTRGDELAHKPPRWLLFTLQVIGLVFYELVADKKLDPAARNEASYSLLADELASRSSGSYFFARYDVPRHLQDTEFKRKWCVAGRWVNDIRTCITMNSAQPASASTGTRSVADMFKKANSRRTADSTHAPFSDLPSATRLVGGAVQHFCQHGRRVASTWSATRYTHTRFQRAHRSRSRRGRGTGARALRRCACRSHGATRRRGRTPRKAPLVAMLLDLSAIR